VWLVRGEEQLEVPDLATELDATSSSQSLARAAQEPLVTLLRSPLLSGLPREQEV
jgi:hypothetical protein